jgi:excisionase family DNA binding protein
MLSAAAEREVARYTWLTIADVAERTGVSTWQVRQWIAKGQLRARNLGSGKRKWYKVHPDWLAEFERERNA